MSHRAGMILCVLMLVTEMSHGAEWSRAERIDVQQDGSPSAGANGLPLPISQVSISDDGRWVVFSTSAEDIVDNDTNLVSDIFLRDRVNGSTRRLILRQDGSQTMMGSSAPAISGDGRFVVFLSSDEQLTAADTNFRTDAFLLDRDANENGVFDQAGESTVALVSVDNAGNSLFRGVGLQGPDISDDGSRIAFSTGFPISPLDDNREPDVYVRNLVTELAEPASVSADGSTGDDASPSFFSDRVVLSDDGRTVAFSSAASDLVDDDSNGSDDVFVARFDSGAVEVIRANLDAEGQQTDTRIDQFDLSGSGEWIAFSFRDTDSLNDPNPTGADIYLRRMSDDFSSRIPFDANQWQKGQGACCGNQFPLISRDGLGVLFRSSQNYSFEPGVTSSFSDTFFFSPSEGLMPVTDFPTPTAQATSFTSFPLALSDSGLFAIIGVIEPDNIDTGQRGTYVYERSVANAVLFANGFENP